LLEYAGQDVFKVRIFPIEPRREEAVSRSPTPNCSSLIRASSATATAQYGEVSAKPIPDVSLKVEVETKAPAQVHYSPSHNVEIKRHGANKATVGYEARNVKPDTDFQIFFAPEADGNWGEPDDLPDQFGRRILSAARVTGHRPQ